MFLMDDEEEEEILFTILKVLTCDVILLLYWLQLRMDGVKN